VAEKVADGFGKLVGGAGHGGDPGFDEARSGVGGEGLDGEGLAAVGEDEAGEGGDPLGGVAGPGVGDGPAVHGVELDAGGEGWGGEELAANGDGPEGEAVLVAGLLGAFLGVAGLDEGAEDVVDLVDVEGPVTALGEERGDGGVVAVFGLDLEGEEGHGRGGIQ
jgi:hypothetical protein